MTISSIKKFPIHKKLCPAISLTHHNAVDANGGQTELVVIDVLRRVCLAGRDAHVDAVGVGKYKARISAYTAVQ